MHGITVSLVIALAAFGPPSGSPQPQSEVPIRVVSSSHEVRYPDEVVFTLEAEAASRIVEVVLYYRLARQSVKVYGYPVFTPSTRVSTNFRLKTGGAGYLPTGLDIEYYYRIVDELGNTLETQRHSLEYSDPGYAWQELRQGELVVLWHDLPEENVREVVANVGRRLEEVKSVLGIVTAPPMKAVILNDRREADRGLPTVSGAATQGHLYGGFAFRSYDLFVLVSLSEGGIVHEATHLMVHEAVDSPLARVPDWLNEGLATYFEARSQGPEPALARAARDGDLVNLAAMNAVPGRPEAVRVFYAKSRSVVTYLIDTYGPERMTSLLRAINGGSRIDAAVREVYGVSLGELDDRWREDVIGPATLTPRPDLGTVATTVMIAGALATAFVVWIYRWLTHRSGPSTPGNQAP